MFLTTNRALCGLKGEIMHSEWSKIVFLLLRFSFLQSLIYVIINNIITNNSKQREIETIKVINQQSNEQISKAMSHKFCVLEFFRVSPQQHVSRRDPLTPLFAVGVAGAN